MTTYRKHLNRPFRDMPKWLILVCVVALLPFYLLRGAAVGVIDQFLLWKWELQDIFEMEEEE